jgi:3-hydroxybutyryl-CoA dehydrogenase
LLCCKYIFYQAPIFVKNRGMRIAVLAGLDQWEEIIRLPMEANCIHLERTQSAAGDYDAWLVADAGQPLPPVFDKPLLLHAVEGTCTSRALPGNCIRINAWKGFLARDHWELAGPVTPEAEAVVQALGRIPVRVADEPGLVTARVLAMIINEAYYALGEGVSTRAEIDTAMKLGTNYPFGPFEWARRIGVQEICRLLQSLQSYGERYRAAPLLMEEANT